MIDGRLNEDIFRDPEITFIAALDASIQAADAACTALLKSRLLLLHTGFGSNHPLCEQYDTHVRWWAAQADGDRRTRAAEYDRIFKVNLIWLLTRQV